MAEVTLRLRARQDTAANWTSSNPILSLGEFGYETDTGAFKIGDGVTAWTSLTYDWVFGGNATFSGSIEATQLIEIEHGAATDDLMIAHIDYTRLGVVKAQTGFLTAVDSIFDITSDAQDGIRLQSSGSANIHIGDGGVNTILYGDGVTDTTAHNFSGPVFTMASTTAGAGFNIAEGVAPTTPNDGDLWITATGEFNARLNGATVNLAGGGDVTKVGTPVDDQVAVWTGDGPIEGTAALQFNSAIDYLYVGNSTLTTPRVFLRAAANGAPTFAMNEAGVGEVFNVVHEGTIDTTQFNSVDPYSFRISSIEEFTLSSTEATFHGDLVANNSTILVTAASSSDRMIKFYNSTFSLNSKRMRMGITSLGEVALQVSNDADSSHQNFMHLSRNTSNQVTRNTISGNDIIFNDGGGTPGDFTIYHPNITLGEAVAPLSANILMAGNNRRLLLSGSASASTGGRLELGGPSYSAPNRVRLSSNLSIPLSYSESGGSSTLSLAGGGGTGTAGTIEISGVSLRFSDGGSPDPLKYTHSAGLWEFSDSTNQILAIDGSGIELKAGDLIFNEAATRANAPAAAKGHVWLRDDVANVLMFTDDTDADFNVSPIEGTFTPTLLGSTTNPTQSYLTQVGTYQQYGNWIHFQATVTMAAAGITAGSGNVTMGGLPDTSGATNRAACSVAAPSGWGTTNGAPSHAEIQASAAVVDLYVYDNDAGNVAGLTNANAADIGNSTSVVISGSYFVG